MATHYGLFLAVAGILYLGRLAFSLYRNIQACRASGIPYIVVPFDPHSIISQILYPIWHPLLSLLPPSIKGKWFIFMKPDLLWSELYAPFRLAGSDTVLTCSPTRVQLQTSAADVISQVTERRGDFPKPTHIYHIIDIYGKTIISCEGDIWKKHRKLTAHPFNEKNNHIVWSESIVQAQELLAHVQGRGQHSSQSIHDLEDLTSRAALAIISKAGYGVRMSWPEQQDSQTPLLNQEVPTEVGSLGIDWVEGKTNGHKMSYADAIFSVSHDVFWLFAFPRSLLKFFPFESARRASKAYGEWGQYMKEMLNAKRKELDGGKDVVARGTDLLSSLVKSSADVRTVVNDNTTSSGKIGVGGFSDDELMGNAFVLIMAGHETTAGALHYGLLLLAMHVQSQRMLQKDVDSIFGDTPPSEWNYERDFSRAFGSMPGATMAEVLRWLPSVPGIPKWTPVEQELTVNGTRCTVPKNAVVTIHAPAAHRNPNQWPHSKPSRPSDLEHQTSNPDDDLGEFKPERWLRNQASNDAQIAQRSSEDWKPSAADTAATLLKPVRGAYLPFSEGGRACLGRRFSQVEMMGLFSVIFQKYSVELAVDEWASDEEVEKMSTAQRRELWDKARAAAKYKFRCCMKNLMTNRMTNTEVPIRFVKRGEERFKAGAW